MSTHIGYKNLRMSAAMSTADKHRRLKQARERAGYEKPGDAADALGVPRPSYYHHEGGTRNFGDEDALRYARKFKVRPEWLVFGIEGQNDHSGEIREIDIRAGASGGGVDDGFLVETPQHGITIAADAVRDVWRMPDSYVRGELRIESSHAWMVEVSGDSGYDPSNPSAPGSLFPGDRVIIDTNDRRPSPPGPFAVFDGVGLVVKLVEVVPQSDPVRIRLSSRNPAYTPYEAVEGEAHIIGRVRAKISIL